METKILHLNLKRQWYEMIESGEKTEEYRELKVYWTKRLTELKRQLCFSERYGYSNSPIPFKHYDLVCFHFGYTKRTMTFEITNIFIGKGKPEWGAPDKPVFIIKLGTKV